MQNQEHVCRACVFLLQNLHKQLEEAIQDGEIWVMQLKDTEYELESSRERVQQQATEILHKASKLCLWRLFLTVILCADVLIHLIFTHHSQNALYVVTTFYQIRTGTKARRD